jgi:hypothetical protein
MRASTPQPLNSRRRLPIPRTTLIPNHLPLHLHPSPEPPRRRGPPPPQTYPPPSSPLRRQGRYSPSIFASRRVAPLTLRLALSQRTTPSTACPPRSPVSSSPTRTSPPLSVGRRLPLLHRGRNLRRLRPARDAGPYLAHLPPPPGASRALRRRPHLRAGRPAPGRRAGRRRRLNAGDLPRTAAGGGGVQRAAKGAALAAAGGGRAGADVVRGASGERRGGAELLLK